MNDFLCTWHPNYHLTSLQYALFTDFIQYVSAQTALRDRKSPPYFPVVPLQSLVCGQHSLTHKKVQLSYEGLASAKVFVISTIVFYLIIFLYN